jgi:hypothetical protein
MHPQARDAILEKLDYVARNLLDPVTKAKYPAYTVMNQEVSR